MEAIETVIVNFKIYDCNTMVCLESFSMGCKFPKTWDYAMRFRKLVSYCNFLHRKHPAQEFKFKLSE